VTLYLDCEFNGHGGELISIALVSDKSPHKFYGVMPLPFALTDWVQKHVVPILGQDPEPENELRFRLKLFLEQFEGEEIIADWPDDFAHLMKLMSGPTYAASFSVPCMMTLLNSGEVRPVLPHNALSDAEALMYWHQSVRGAA